MKATEAAKNPSRTGEQSPGFNEGFYRTIVEQSHECVVILNLKGDSEYVSPAIKSLLGYTTEEYKIANKKGIVHPEDIDRINATYAKLMTKPKSSVIEEVRLRHKDGTWRWIEAAGTNLLHNPNIKGIVVYMRDIPKRKEAEEELQYRTALFEAQNEATPDGILVVDTKGKILYYNQRFAEIWKMPKKILESSDDQGALEHAMTMLKDPKGFIERVDYIYAHPEEASHEEVYFKDGRVIDRFGVPVHDQSGHEYGWAWYFRDITQAKKAEEAVKAQNEYLSALQETAVALSRRLQLNPLLNAILEHSAQLAGTKDGYIYLTDEAEGTLSVKVAIGIFQEYVGLTIKKGEGLAGRVWETSKPLVIDDYDSWSERSNRFPKGVFKSVVGIPLFSGTKVVGVIALAHRSKNKRFSEVQMEALTRLSELASIAFDNTVLYERNLQEIEDRKHAEALNLNLAEQQERLLELNRSKDEFISLASHQLRTPATGVKQYVGMLLAGYAGRISEQQRQLLNTAYESNERQLKIINDLLKVAHLDAGKVSLQKTMVDIVDLIEDVIDEQADTFKSRGQGAIFKRSEKSILVRVDEDRIRMVLENLIDNASKYSLHGSTVVISVKKYGRNLLVRVKDQGVGIDQQDQDKLFKKFSRIDNPLSTLVGGTGLGLYWAKEIIDLHGGTIEVDSQVKKGTTFTIRLPL